tara:strand:+ start:32 stop:379 length:348 start_codon:yes stop_codon:yes gene_type:complete
MKYLFSIFVILTVVFFAIPVKAQMNTQSVQSFCGPIDKKDSFIKNLEKSYTELKIFRGLSTKSGHIFEFYYNPKSLTFTVLGITATHVCILDWGENGEFILEFPKEDLKKTGVKA